MKRFNYLRLFAFAAASLLMSACAFDKEPATPKQTFETYVRALKKKDITTMKLLLSKDTIKMHEQEAKSSGVTLDDIVKRETLIGEGQSTVEYRNEKIEGDHATLEYKNLNQWETIPFVKEDGEWKIDKKGYADQLIQDVEQQGQQFDETTNRDRQPY
jgi:hypothetical protein